MAQANELIHQSLRLRIMAVLHGAQGDEPIEFNRLKALVDATDGNLSTHLSTLENAGYLNIAKDFVGKRPRTRIAISAAGAAAFRDHMAYLRAIIDAASPG